MLKFWLNRDLSKGLHAYDAANGVEIVEVHYFDGDFDGMEPSVSLEDVEAMMCYIQQHFPGGWRIVNGEVRAR